jgi:hypothetical protein
MTSEVMTTRGREKTEQGVDKELAAHYYARWKFIDDLLPGLKKAKEAGEDAKVLSVLGAGKGGPIDLEDLGMQKRKFWPWTSILKRTSRYTDLMMEVITLPMVTTHACF